jgi:hypothetical protein
MSSGELDGLRAGLKALAADLRRVEAPARVEERVLAAFRERGTKPVRPAPLPRRGWWFPLAAWATAAAAGTALGVFLMRDHSPARVHQPVRSVLQLAVVDPSAGAETVSGDDSGFIPLPNAESISPNEEVDVVRVEVTRSAILALGLPVSEEAATEKVKADIALGADGLARAVRILDE